MICLSSHKVLKTLLLEKLSFLLSRLEGPLCRYACDFCEVCSLQNIFSRVLFVFLEKGWTVARQPTSVQLSVESGCSQRSWLSSGLEKHPCHLLQIPLFSKHPPFGGKTNAVAAFPWVHLQLAKEPVAWLLGWYWSHKAGLTGGFQWCQPGRVPGPHTPAELSVWTSHPRRTCRVWERNTGHCSCSAPVYGKARSLTMYFALVPYYLKHTTIIHLNTLW